MFITHKKVNLAIDIFYIFQIPFILYRVREIKLLVKKIGISKNIKSQDLLLAIEEILYFKEVKFRSYFS